MQERDLQLQPRWVALLARTHETGMGYHLVDIEMTDGRVFKNVPVFSSEYARVPAEFGDRSSKDITKIQVRDRDSRRKRA